MKDVISDLPPIQNGQCEEVMPYSGEAGALTLSLSKSSDSTKYLTMSCAESKETMLHACALLQD